MGRHGLARLSADPPCARAVAAPVAERAGCRFWPKSPSWRDHAGARPISSILAVGTGGHRPDPRRASRAALQHTAAQADLYRRRRRCPREVDPAIDRLDGAFSLRSGRSGAASRWPAARGASGEADAAWALVDEEVAALLRDRAERDGGAGADRAAGEVRAARAASCWPSRRDGRRRGDAASGQPAAARSEPRRCAPSAARDARRPRRAEASCSPRCSGDPTAGQGQTMSLQERLEPRRAPPRGAARACCRRPAAQATIRPACRRSIAELSTPIVAAIEELRGAEHELADLDEMIGGRERSRDAGDGAPRSARRCAERLPELEHAVKLLLLPQGRGRARTRSWRSAPAPAATRRRCSPPTCSACTSATPRSTAGGSR